VPRNSIQQLSQALVNRIAAGEAIERPASVVKELVENSLDAGASHIIVEIEDGGRSLIRVIDNGNGIPSSELPLAMAAHATSKLLTDDDLFRINTMGFRGEALASIGAVSQARLLSRTPDDEIAFEIHNHGGKVDAPQAAAGNTGTVVEVRNLFFNTPARRKFLKGEATEFGHIADALQRLALASPDISFKLLHNNRPASDFPATSPKERWLTAWPAEFAQLALDISATDAEIALDGLIGLPELARPTTKYQYIFLNGRPIRDRTVQHALREAYRGLTEPGRQPAAVLLLSVPPQDVDVNVHPTKSEVRFRDTQRIHSLVLSALREKLLSSDLTPAAVARSAAATQESVDLRQKLADFFRANSSDSTTSSQPAPQSAEIWSPPPSPTLSSTPTSSPASAESILPQAQNLAVPAIQLHNSYLVVESEDGLVIIDQHALHERILYEDLLARVSRGNLESQQLLIPLTFPASPRQQEMLEQIQPLLRRLGVDAGAIGPDGVAIHSFPSFLHRLDPVAFLQDVLDRGEQESLDLHDEELLHEILDMMSCKAAIKAGDALSAEEISALLARRQLIDRSSNCPHGRPTTLRLTLRDLEKQFKRTGF
jgi:DNA mismatch repair protein MutL